MKYAAECPLCKTLILFEESRVQCPECNAMMDAMPASQVAPWAYHADIEVVAE